MRNMTCGNLALLSSRMTKGESFAHAFVTRHVSEKILLSPKTSNNSFHYPLFSPAPTVGSDPSANLTAGFLEALGEVVPEDALRYIYALLYAPSYRLRYGALLTRDFPRIPLTSDRELFRDLCRLGSRLVTLHLMEADNLASGAKYEGSGENRVEKVRYSAPGQGAEQGRVWINATQYFEGVPPEVWEFHVGGYQVCARWLKDRKGRLLSYADLTHYQYVVAALAETIALMRAIDEVIDAHGGWPLS